MSELVRDQAAEALAELLRLPGYMVPSRIHVLASLPKTSTGKIARAELPDLVLAAR